MLRLCLATAKQSVIQAPSPLTRKVDLRKKLMHKTKFNKTKFSTLKAQVSVHQIQFRRKFTASDLRAYFAAISKKRVEFITAKAKSGKMR